MVLFKRNFTTWFITKKPMSFDDVVIVSVEGNNYRINFWFKTKSEAMDRIKKVRKR